MHCTKGDERPIVSSSTVFNEPLRRLEVIRPGVNDLSGARCALVRLQMIYDLPLKDFFDGFVAGHRSQPLSQQDVLLIGLTAVNMSQPHEAIEWLSAAFEHGRPPAVHDSLIHHALAKAHAAVRIQTYLQHYRPMRIHFELFLHVQCIIIMRINGVLNR